VFDSENNIQNVGLRKREDDARYIMKETYSEFKTSL
jgi:hypothetical protein